MKRVRCHYRAASDSCRLRGVRSFIKSDLSLQSNVRSCEDLSSNKAIDATVVKPLLALQSSWSRRANFQNGNYYLYPSSTCIPVLSCVLREVHEVRIYGGVTEPNSPMGVNCVAIKPLRFYLFVKIYDSDYHVDLNFQNFLNFSTKITQKS